MRNLLLLFLFITPGFLSAQTAPTPTLSFTPTGTFTKTPTRTNTPTITPTPMMTGTPTVTATGTLPTKTFTPTITSTPTQSPTGTLATATFTHTKTPTHTVTMTPTATSTPGVFKFNVSPKPEPDGQIKFQWGTTIKAREINVKIFTSGFRLVRQFSFDKKEHSENLSPGEHEMSWDGKDEQGRAMPSGNYLCFIVIETEKKDYDASAKTNIP